MANINSMKRKGKSKNFKYVYWVEFSGIDMWRAELHKYKWQKVFAFDKERDAAKEVDLKLIENGESPINILVRM